MFFVLVVIAVSLEIQPSVCRVIGVTNDTYIIYVKLSVQNLGKHMISSDEILLFTIRRLLCPIHERAARDD